MSQQFNLKQHNEIVHLNEMKSNRNEMELLRL